MEGVFPTLARLLPVIAGKVVSPVPTAALVLLLMGHHGRTRGLGFLTGWFLGTLTLGTAILLSGAKLHPAHHAWFQQSSELLELGFGLLFLVLAGLNLKKLRQRRGQEALVGTPRWLHRIEQFTFGKAVLLGLGLGTFGAPKNTTLVLQALVEIMGADLGVASQVLVFFLFDLFGSLVMLTLFVTYVGFAPRSGRFLERLKDWLIEHDDVILLVLFIILGIYFLGKGIKILP